MTAERISPAVPVDDLASAVDTWSRLLGVDATFVDGDRWAQFDVGGSRLSLAGADRTSEEVAVMVKVDDLDAARVILDEAGAAPGPVEQGPHERRFTVRLHGTEIVVYAAV